MLAAILQCFGLHIACLMTSSWMLSQPAIHGLGSGFHEPETSLPHAKMRWHRWFHPNTLDRSALACFHVPAIALAIHVTPGAKPMLKKMTHIPSHPNVSNAFSLPMFLANPPFTHMAGHVCMKCMGNRLCPHTPGTRVTLI